MSDGFSDNPGFCDCGPCKEICYVCQKMRWTSTVLVDGKAQEICEDCRRAAVKERCPECNAVGAAHCAHPEECGGMKPC